jgi:CelD/BcsL family acetyltransferase involved in cellulose biosynthesis
MHEPGPLTRQARRHPALKVEPCPGIPDLIDAAAANAAPEQAFLRAAWFRAASAGAADAITLAGSRPDGRVLAALPTVRHGRWKFLGRSVPGSYWPFRSIPVAADASGAELESLLSDAAARAALGRVWRLGPVYESEAGAGRLVEAAAAAGWSVLERRLGTSFLIDLAAKRGDGVWPSSKTLRKNRWIESRLAEHGPLDFTTIQGTGWTDAAFDTLAAIERNSWVVKRGGDAKFASPAQRRLWQEAVKDPALAAMMRAALLSIGGTPAAFAFSVEAGKTRHYIANGYDERFARHSVGRALLYRDFAHAIEAGCDRIGWGAGDSGYKTEMGAVPGPAILDYLMVRGPLLAAALRPLWR